VATDLWIGEKGMAASISAASGQSAADVAAGAASQMVTGRFTTPTEVADLVVMLSGDAMANITGADFRIDGGLVTTL
jgi:NAD(P)-dependent dehydrogenase (short-subunit alcohol dehydrogenase family)